MSKESSKPPKEAGARARWRKDRKGGRPQVLTMAKRTVLIAMFHERATKEVACREAGISTKTLDRAMERDPEVKSEMLKARDFPNRVAKQSVIRHMERDGQLALKYLERTDPEFKPKMVAQSSDEDRAEQMRKIEEAGLGVPENPSVGEGFMPVSRKK